MSAQRWADAINMWPNAVETFKRPLAGALVYKKVCLGYSRIHKSVNKKYFKKSKNAVKNKIIICGIHYFITKKNTKIDVIPRSCFKSNHLVALTF